MLLSINVSIPPFPRGLPEHLFESCVECRQIPEAGLEGDGGDAAVAVAQAQCRATQAQTQQPVIGRAAGDAAEAAQEMVFAHAGKRRQRIQAVRLVHRRFDMPQHGGYALVITG